MDAEKIGQIDRLEISLKDSVDLSRIAERIRELLPSGSLLQRPADMIQQSKRMLRAFRVNLIALSCIALIVGSILLYNTVTIAVVRWRSEIATLRALGAARTTVAGLFLLESVLLGLIGAVGGIFLGRLMAQTAGLLVEQTVRLFHSDAPLVGDWSEEGIWFYGGVLTLGVLLAGMSGLFPSLRASAMAPARILRKGPLSARRPARLTSLTRFGVASLALGAACCLVPPWDGLPVFGFLAALVFILGVTLLAPRPALSLTRLLKVPLTRLFSAEGQLGVRTIQANIYRVIAATSRLMIAVALLVGVSTMVGSFRRTVSVWVEQTLRGDIYTRAGGSVPRDWSATLELQTVSDLESLKGVATIERFRGRTAVLGGVPLTLAGLDFQILGNHGRLLFTDGRSTAQVASSADR